MINLLINPKHFLRLAIIITVVLIGSFGLLMKNTMDNMAEYSEHDQIDRNYTTDIRFYSEVLTNSAMLAAITGDGQWEKRYRRFESRLDQAIKDILLHDATGDYLQLLQTTDSANIRLVAMENRVFELVGERKLDEALAIVTSSEYARQKAAYVYGLEAFIKLHDHQTDQHQARLRKEIKLSNLYFALFIIFLFAVWLPAERFIQKSRVQMIKQNRELNLILENAPAMTYTCLAYGNFDATYISASIHEKLGYTTEEFLKIPGFWAMNIHPDDKEKVFTELSNLFEKGEHQHEYRFKHKNGDWRWMSDSLKLINDSNGAPMEIIGYWLDITEKKKSEQEITALNERFNLVAKATNDCVYDWDLLSNQIWWNNRIHQQYNYSPEIVFTDIGWWEEKIHPDDLENLMQSVEKVFDEKLENWMGEYRLRKADGSYAEVFDRGFILYDKEKNPIRWLGSFIDITERKKLELKMKELNQRFQLISQATSDTLYDWDLVSDTAWWGGGATIMFGYADKEVENNLEWFMDKVHPDDRKALDESFEHAIDTGMNNWSSEYRFRHRNGDYLIVFDRAFLLFDDDGNPFRSVGSMQDITERKKAEVEIINLNATLELKVEERTAQLAIINENLIKEIEERKQTETELQKAKDQAEAANTSKSEFFSRTSHELRTPLNAILGFAQLMKMGELTSSQAKGVEQILKSGKRLLSLINDVLEISRIENGQFLIFDETVKLDKIIPETMETVRSLAEQRKIRLEFIESPASNLSVNADGQKLKKILFNLLDNAVKYNLEGGGVRVECSLKAATGRQQPEVGTQRVRISVTDTGTGISTDELQKLFRPFERIGNLISEVEGTGLGLSVAKKLTESMGGTIGVESEVGVGSTFWIELHSA